MRDVLTGVHFGTGRLSFGDKRGRCESAPFDAEAREGVRPLHEKREGRALSTRRLHLMPPW